MLVAGDTIHALFGFPNGVTLRWNLVKRNGHVNTNFSRREKWAMETLGTRGIAQQSSFGFLWLDSPFFPPKGDSAQWQDLPKPTEMNFPVEARHPIRSLIHAIEVITQPVCRGYAGRWTIAMVAAVPESQRTTSRVIFPLQDRGNPLLRR